MKSSEKPAAAVALVVGALGWALAPIFIRILSPAYDATTLNFLRYASASIPLLAISIAFYRRDLARSFRFFWGIGAVTLVNVAMQWLWTIGCARSAPTTAQLISKLSVVFVILFSFMAFREERGVIKSRLYIFGTILSLLALPAVISDNPASIIPVLDPPTLMLIASAALWGVYTVSSKGLVMLLHPVPMFAVLSAYETIVFAAAAFALGNPASILDADARTTTLAIVSGVVSVAMAHTAFHFAQKHLGSALCSSVNLFNPIITYAIALSIWPDERLILTQWIGGSVLILGTLLVVYAGQRVHRSQSNTTTCHPDS